MLDYAGWVRRRRKFIVGRKRRSAPRDRDKFTIEIGRPLRNDELNELAEALDCGLPPPLRAFLETGASSIVLAYTLPPGDDENYEIICYADELVGWRAECVEYARDSWLKEPDWPLDQAFWRHGLPLVHYPDGDGVALWVHDPKHPNPPVIYLNHDDESFLLSRNFDDFLQQWEQLGYAAIGGLPDYRNPKTGFLDSTTTQAKALRKERGLDE
jgi:hypothetical protein